MWHCSLVLLTVVKPDTEENFYLLAPSQRYTQQGLHAQIIFKT